MDNIQPWSKQPTPQPANFYESEANQFLGTPTVQHWRSPLPAMPSPTPEIETLRQQIIDLQAANTALREENTQLQNTLHQQRQDWAIAQQRSESASLAKSTFLATMSHELRTPLHAILGLSQVLQQEIFGALNAKQTEYLNHIHESGEYLLLLINDILDLAKIEAGRETLTLAEIAIAEFCQTCLTLVQEQAREHQLELSFQIEEGVVTWVADERRLRQMVLNLLSNAIKFTHAGSISLIVHSQAQGLAFTIADTGIGIAAEQLSQLFQPFCQLDSQLNRQFSGTGLGLALTRHLAQLHGGDVTVESTLGQGSRFTIYLPLASKND